MPVGRDLFDVGGGGFKGFALAAQPCGGGVHHGFDEKTQAGRYVFLVFMLRKMNGKNRLRPISARYMHQKEINHYEKSA
jgi:uncharacterized protein